MCIRDSHIGEPLGALVIEDRGQIVRAGEIVVTDRTGEKFPLLAPAFPRVAETFPLFAVIFEIACESMCEKPPIVVHGTEALPDGPDG